MPPTLAAAMKTYSGLSRSKNSRTARPSVSSSSACRRSSKFEYPARSSARRIADPASPVCPARYMRAPRSTELLASAVGAVTVTADQRIALRRPQVFTRHLGNQLRERDPRLPPKPPARLGGVSQQRLDFGGTEIARIYPYDRLPGLELARRALRFEAKLGDHAALVLAFTFPAQHDAQL